jgi:hypothetical protein
MSSSRPPDPVLKVTDETSGTQLTWAEIDRIRFDVNADTWACPSPATLLGAHMWHVRPVVAAALAVGRAARPRELKLGRTRASMRSVDKSLACPPCRCTPTCQARQSHSTSMLSRRATLLLGCSWSTAPEVLPRLRGDLFRCQRFWLSRRGPARCASLRRGRGQRPFRVRGRLRRSRERSRSRYWQ